VAGEWDLSELHDLQRDLAEAPVKALPLLAAVVKESAAELEKRWKANARRTAGRHGRLYPDAITTTVHGLEAEVGPESDRPQGGMGRGFEYGSSNQPPHNDGGRAAQVVEPLFYKAVDDVLGKLL
jgi:hypothetical protein